MHGALDLWAPSTRRRLVRFCSAITRDGQAAEDLAQETLLEAWRNAHKLRDPAGADRWLAAVARNVCLRWGRQRGRDISALAPLDEEAAVAGDVDLDAGLDRAELAELVDRALSELPTDTRDVVVRRYVDERSHGEIADALGISADAVAMRLTRGKAVLRRVLATDRHGLADSHQWRPTRIWCSECGARKLLVRREPGSIAFRCPGCMEDTSSTGREFDLGNPSFAALFENLVRPTAVLDRKSTRLNSSH